MIWAHNERLFCWEASAYGWRAMITRAADRHAYRAAVAPFDMPDRTIRASHVFAELRDAQAWCIAEIAHQRLEA
jgi:hypothetical protein